MLTVKFLFNKVIVRQCLTWQLMRPFGSRNLDLVKKLLDCVKCLLVLLD